MQLRETTMQLFDSLCDQLSRGGETLVAFRYRQSLAAVVYEMTLVEVHVRGEDASREFACRTLAGHLLAALAALPDGSVVVGEELREVLLVLRQVDAKFSLARPDLPATEHAWLERAAEKVELALKEPQKAPARGRRTRRGSAVTHSEMNRAQEELRGRRGPAPAATAPPPSVLSGLTPFSISLEVPRMASHAYDVCRDASDDPTCTLETHVPSFEARRVAGGTERLGQQQWRPAARPHPHAGPAQCAHL